MYLGVDIDENGKMIPPPPALMSPPFTGVSWVDGLAMILSTEEQFHRAMQGGSTSSSEPCAIEVNLTLSEPLWPILDEDEQFRRFCLAEIVT